MRQTTSKQAKNPKTKQKAFKNTIELFFVSHLLLGMHPTLNKCLFPQ